MNPGGVQSVDVTVDEVLHVFNDSDDDERDRTSVQSPHVESNRRSRVEAEIPTFVKYNNA